MSLSVTVILPLGWWRCHEEAQLVAVEEQAAQAGAELIVLENAAPCARDAVIDALGSRPDARVICAHERRSPPYSRNVGAQMASGEVLVFVDADDLVAPGWLSHLTKPFEDPDVAAVGGRFDEVSLNMGVLAATRENLSAEGLPVGFYFRPYAPSSNVAIRAKLFRAVGGFDETHVGAEDIDISWRLAVVGADLVYAPDALVHVRYRRDLLASCLQGFRWGCAGARLVASWRLSARVVDDTPRLPSLSYRAKQASGSARRSWHTRTAGPLAREVCYQTGMLIGWMRGSHRTLSEITPWDPHEAMP